MLGGMPTREASPSSQAVRPARASSPASRRFFLAASRVDYACRVPTRIVQSTGPGETEALGAQLAAELSSGDVVLVRGELGAGKTTLVRGAAQALGVTDAVTSPSFSIGHRYRAGDQLTV